MRVIVVVMKAVILAGGHGKRLRPITESVPKALVEVGKRPIIEWQILWLRSCGISSFVILTGYLGKKLEEHLDMRKKAWNVGIEYSEEKEPLGTGGALLNAESLLKGKESFIMLNGDNITNIDIRQLSLDGSVAAIALVPLRSTFGIAVLDNGRIAEFLEKPMLKEYWMNAGVYLMRSDIFRYLPEKGDLEKTAFMALSKKLMLKGVKFPDAYFKGVDSVKDKEEASADLDSGTVFKELG